MMVYYLTIVANTHLLSGKPTAMGGSQQYQNLNLLVYNTPHNIFRGNTAMRIRDTV